MSPLTLPDYVRDLDRQLNRISDLGERAVYINMELDILDAMEERLGHGLPRLKAALLVRKAFIIQTIREQIRKAQGAPMEVMHQ